MAPSMEPIIKESRDVRKISDYLECLTYFSSLMGVLPDSMHKAIMKGKAFEEKWTSMYGQVTWNDVKFQVSEDGEFFVVYDAESQAKNMADEPFVLHMDVRLDFTIKNGRIKFGGREQKPKYVPTFFG